MSFSDSVPDCGNDLATVFMIHKRELSDSTIESGSSLFYLFHCSAHDRLNTMPFRLFRNTPHGLHPACNVAILSCVNFASAHPARIASRRPASRSAKRCSLPQHTPHGLHQQNRTDAMPQIHAICCELVDSFSDATKAASALTIFPRFSTVKAIYSNPINY